MDNTYLEVEHQKTTKNIRFTRRMTLMNLSKDDENVRNIIRTILAEIEDSKPMAEELPTKSLNENMVKKLYDNFKKIDLYSSLVKESDVDDIIKMRRSKKGEGSSFAKNEQKVLIFGKS